MNRCIKCSREFEARKDAKYCSTICKQDYWNNKNRIKKNYKKISELTQEDLDKIIQARPELQIKMNDNENK